MSVQVTFSSKLRPTRGQRPPLLAAGDQPLRLDRVNEAGRSKQDICHITQPQATALGRVHGKRQAELGAELGAELWAQSGSGPMGFGSLRPLRALQ